VNLSMRENKGMFQDPEVGTEAHDQICAMLTGNNVAHDLLHLVGLSPQAEVRVDLESPVYGGRNGFLLGFADAILKVEYKNVLIEVKTSQIRMGEVLRQINAYKLPLRVDHVILLHVQQIDQPSLNAFASQKILCVQVTKEGDSYYLNRQFDLPEKKEEASPLLPNPLLPDFDPSGRPQKNEIQEESPNKASQELVSKKDSPLDVPYQAGQKVSHPKFGIGKVQGLNGEGTRTEVEILFDDYGPKRLLLKYANCEILSEKGFADELPPDFWGTL
jgi:hypothetical protein